MGEMPPNTSRSWGRTARTAAVASNAMWAKPRHCGSNSKFQWERLLGSFQTIKASNNFNPHGPVLLYGWLAPCEGLFLGVAATESALGACGFHICGGLSYTGRGCHPT